MQKHDDQRLKLLLVAYDFPPIPSPQSLRWAYLAAELERSGVEVHVLAPDVAGYGNGGLPELPAGVTVHRVWPGPVAAWRAYLKRRKNKPGHLSATSGAFEPYADSGITEASVKLNWKGRTRRFVLNGIRVCTKPILSLLGAGTGGLLDAIGARLLFPDLRAEWTPWAMRRLETLLLTLHPDVVVTSHEPANSIPLGIQASKRGFCWVADLGDPILAPYTPSHWKKRAMMLEREVCQRANLITLTSTAAQKTLEQRHPDLTPRSYVLTQGFDHRYGSDAGGQVRDDVFSPDLLELLYTGSFYSFRSAAALVDAVMRTDGVRLNVASISPSHDILEAVATHPTKFRILGFVPHRQVLGLQRTCDVLINLANADPVQVPGKLYEYLGAGVPILHVGDQQDDVAAGVVRAHRVGWVMENDSYQLAELMAMLVKGKREEGPARRTSHPGIQNYAWENIAKQLLTQLRDVPGGRLGAKLTPRPSRELGEPK